MEKEADLPDDIQDFPKELTLSPHISTPHSNRKDISDRLMAIRPDDFAEDVGLKTNRERKDINLHESEKERIKLVSEILHNPKLQELINAGKITVALIKPHVHKGKSNASDEVIANQILKVEIKKPLKVIFSLPIHMTPNDVRYFYDSIYQMLSTKPDPETNGKTMVWKRLEDYMTSGATTMVLLYSEEENAVDEWRRQLGPTMPEKDTEGTTIRGKFGWDIRGNVGHGSNADTPEEKVAAVKYEAGWMKDKVDRMLKASEKDDKYMTEERIRADGILEDGEVFLAIEKFIPKQRVSIIGSSFTAYIVSFIGKNGKQGHRRFLVKSFDNKERKGSNINQGLAEGEERRIKLFKELLERTTPSRHKKRLSIGTPKTYKVSDDNEGSPALIREYVPSSNRKVLSIVNDTSFDSNTRCEMINGLIYAAALMDIEGIKSRNIVENFLYNGRGWIYFGSSSIGIQSQAENQVSTGLADLLQSFGDDPELSNQIRRRYNAHRKSLLSKKIQSQNQ